MSKYWHLLVDFGFRLLYNEMAWSYDAVSWAVSLGRWRSWQQTALGYLDGGRILEIAQGPGHMMVHLQNGGFDVVGIDLSWEMVKIARKRLRRQGLQSLVVLGEAGGLPFAQNSFGAVLSTFPTVFIMDQDTPMNIFRVLKPGGRLVILLLARLTGRGVITRILEWVYRISGQRPDESEHAEHIKGKFSGLYEKAGFQVSFEQVIDNGSEVTLLIGEKPSNS